MSSDLAAMWLFIADTATRGYSPLYDRICRAVADNEEVLSLVREAPAPAHNPLLCLAAVHYLVLGGLEHPLTDVYNGTSDTDPGPLFVDVCLTHRAEILDLLATQQVNTNEVGRSAVLAPGLTEMAERHGAPLAHIDVGCSAGLNLLADHYRLDYGSGGATGPPDAPVQIECEIVGGSPPIRPRLPEITARVGLDRAPVDIHDPKQVRWQLACAWPDTNRVARTRLALEEAQRVPMTLVQGDAVADIGGLIAKLPPGATAVVTTTWVVAYFPHEQRTAFRAALADASRDRLVTWISIEGKGVVDTIPAPPDPFYAHGVEYSVIGGITFQGGEERAEMLGYAQPHGRGLHWSATR